MHISPETREIKSEIRAAIEARIKSIKQEGSEDVAAWEYEAELTDALNSLEDGTGCLDQLASEYL